MVVHGLEGMVDEISESQSKDHDDNHVDSLGAPIMGKRGKDFVHRRASLRDFLMELHESSHARVKTERSASILLRIGRKHRHGLDANGCGTLLVAIAIRPREPTGISNMLSRGSAKADEAGSRSHQTMKNGRRFDRCRSCVLNHWDHSF